MTRTLRVLAWPGMPAAGALDAAAATFGATVEVVAVSSNERLERLLAGPEPWDVVFPSDYLVERLRGQGRLARLDAAVLPLDRLAAWARELPFDPGCAVSVPFAYGTTGWLGVDAAAGDGRESWAALFDPPAGVEVGMLDELREVVGAALIAAGHDPNATDPAALERAQALLRAQRPRVARYDSDDFCGPVESGAVAVHQAWSGPASHAVRRRPGLRYVVPREGATMWVTCAAVPADAPDPAASQRLIAELMAPELAARTTREHGYATPNAAARIRLPADLADDPVLFPDEATLCRCHVLRDLGPEEARLAAVYRAGTGRDP